MVTEVALKVLPSFELKVTGIFAIPTLAELVNDTVYVPEPLKTRVAEPPTVIAVPVTATGTVAEALEAVAVTVMLRSVGSPAALKVAMAAPVVSVVA